MAQCYLDEDSYNILKNFQAEMKKGGISGCTLGDAIRIIRGSTKNRPDANQ
jgi:hypothetical protein